MRKVQAFLSDFDTRTLHGTARTAREAEFDHLWAEVRQAVGGYDMPSLEQWHSMGIQLRGNIYPMASRRLIAAAAYLGEHQRVLTGDALDPADSPEPTE